MSDYRDPNDPLYGNTWYEPPEAAPVRGDGLQVAPRPW